MSSLRPRLFGLDGGSARSYLSSFGVDSQTPIAQAQAARGMVDAIRAREEARELPPGRSATTDST